MARFFLWLIAAVATQACFGAAPAIERLSPLAFRSNGSTELELKGSDIPTGGALWTSFPTARVEPSGTEPGQFTVSLSNAPVGIGLLRLFTSNGVSNPKFVFVDDLPTVRGTNANTSRERAQVVSVGTAMEGRCKELQVEWFRITARKDQRFTFEVVAHRIGSRLDSVLRMSDAQGRELARNDDWPGWRGDSAVRFTAPSAGDYWIELRDVNYGGGADFFYRLRVGDFNPATTAFPCSVTAGKQQSFTLLNTTAEIGRIKATAGSNLPVLALSVPGRHGSTHASAFVSELPQYVRDGDRPQKPVAFQWPCGISGRFQQPGEPHHYEFTANKSDVLEFRAATRSLGSPCDVGLSVRSADGKVLARSNVAAADEGVLNFTAPSNGIFRLQVEEATAAAGLNLVYTISIEPSAGFTLQLDTDRVQAAPGSSFELKVSCVRTNLKGAIELTVEGLPEGASITNATLAEGKTNTTMKVTLPVDLAPALPRFIRVFGTTSRDGKPVRVRASTAAAVRRAFPQMLYPPMEWDGVVALGITAK